MSRRLIRTLKRTVMAGVKPHAEVSQADRARESALALLERSIAFGHERLALVRLSPAARTGADIPPSHWNYCRETAGRSRDARLQTLWLAAAQVANRRHGQLPPSSDRQRPS